MTGMERLQAMVRGEVEAPPISKLIGIELLEVAPGRATFALDADTRHANPMGTLHGGVLCDLGDAAMGCAIGTSLEDGETYTTVELRINFFKPIWKQRLTARGTVVRRTRKLAYAEAEITDEKGSLVAKLSSSCLILKGDDAMGR
jgi:uncharacterized protein (TIGR00369 family)